jgi:hypothetical protein
LVVNTTIDDFRNRISSWSLEVPPASRAIQAIPGLVFAKQRGGRTIVTVADSDAETEAAMMRIGADSLERLPITFGEAVVAYLSQSRESDSFFANTGA